MGAYSKSGKLFVSFQNFLKSGEYCNLVGVASIPTGYKLELYELHGSWLGGPLDCIINGRGVTSMMTLYAGNCPGGAGACIDGTCTLGTHSPPCLSTGCGFEQHVSVTDCGETAVKTKWLRLQVETQRSLFG